MLAPPAIASAQGTVVPAGPITLSEAMRLAARQGAGPAAARHRIDQARARAREARADLLPSVSGYALQSGRTFNTATFGLDFPTAPGEPPLFDPNGQVEGPVRLLDVRARAEMPLIDLAALGRTRAAGSEVDASRAEADVAAELAALEAASTYLQTLRNGALVQARLADSLLADSLVGIARLQLEAGVAVGLDVTRAQAQLASARAELIAARNARDRSALALRRTLGVPLDAPLVLADSLGALDASGPTGADAASVRRAVERRPEIRAVAAELRAAEQTASAERAARLPTLEVFGDYGVIGSGTAHLLGTYDWGVQVAVPIFSGFTSNSRIAGARARAEELAVRRRDLEAGVALDVRSAHLDLAATREQVDAARERLALAELEVTQARERFQNGLSGNADVITALLALNAARTLEINTVTAYRAAAVALARATGTLLDIP